MATGGNPPIEYLEHERTTWFFVGISGSDLSNGKDGIGRRSNGKKRVLAEKLKELEKRKKRRKKGREGRRNERRRWVASRKAVGLSRTRERFGYMLVCMLERYQVSNEPNVRKTNGLPRSRAHNFERTQPDRGKERNSRDILDTVAVVTVIRAEDNTKHRVGLLDPLLRAVSRA